MVSRVILYSDDSLCFVLSVIFLRSSLISYFRASGEDHFFASRHSVVNGLVLLIKLSIAWHCVLFGVFHVFQGVRVSASASLFF